MRMLTCKRIYEDGIIQEFDLHLEAIDMVTDYFPKAEVKNAKKIPDPKSCAIVLRCGAAMRINYSRKRLAEEMRKA